MAAAVDINPAKQGSWLPGTATPVVGPSDLARFDPALVLIMNPIYEQEITSMISDLDVRTKIQTLASIRSGEVA